MTFETLARLSSPRRLNVQVALIVFAVVVASFVGLTNLLRADLAEHSAIHAQSQATTLAQQISAQSLELLERGERRALDDVVHWAAGFANVLNLRIVDPAGRTLTGSLAETDAAGSIELTPSDRSRTLVLGERNKLTVWQPIVSDTLLGWVRFDYSLASAAALHDDLKNESLYRALLVALLAVAVAFLLLRSPLSAIRDATRFVKDLDTRAGQQMKVERSVTEIAELQTSLNLISLRLENQDSEISDAIEHLNAVLANTTTGIITIDNRGIVETFNPAAEEIFGYNASDIVLQNVSMLMPEPYRHAHDGYLDNYLHTGERTFINQVREVEILRKGGERRTVEISVGEMPIHGDVHFVASMNDITERKRAEEALKRSEQRFRDIAEFAGDWIWETDDQNRYTYFSEQMEKTLGLDADALLGKTRLDLPWVDQTDPRWQKLADKIAARQEFRDFPFAISGPGVELRYVQIGGKPVFDVEGAFLGYRGTGRDITAQVEAEADVARKTALLHATFENMVEGMIVVDGDGQVAAFNARFLQLFDLPAKTVVVGMPIEQLIRFNAARGEYGPGETEDLTQQRIERRSLGSRIEEHIRPDGTILETRRNRLPDGGWVTTYTDMTDRKRVEEEFRQAQKMEAVGRLTAGVAHEFNNLLTAIGGFARLMGRHADDPETVRDWTEDIIGAADQGASLTKQLLAFSHSQPLDLKIAPIGSVIDEIEPLLRPTIGELISMSFDVADGDVLVKIDAGRISQAVINLVINAKDAMPDGGNLTVATHAVDLEADFTDRFEGASPGRYMALSVTDTGTGIEEEVMEKIFEPFFTTKEVGKGTGLGLSMVYGTVQKLGGIITADSEIGVGTRITIYLPLADTAEIMAHKAETAAAETGSETILIAEDENRVRQLVRVTLEGLGYTVLMAEDGMKALEVFNQHQDRIDLLLADVRMPGLDGHQLAAKLTAERPDLKVIFMTGYDELFDSMRESVEKDGTVVLRKPFDLDDMARTLRRVLDARSDAITT